MHEINMEREDEVADQTNCINQECNWVQQERAIKTLNDIEVMLFECLYRLNSSKKVSKHPKVPVAAVELRTVNLMSPINRDIFSAKVVILAEDLQSAEVSFKHIREQGGVYRGQLKSPYKIQQLQDCANKIARTMKCLTEGREKFLKATKDNQYNQKTARCLSSLLREIRDSIKSCIKTLSPPDIKNYWELYNSSLTGYFDPTPPSDLLFSFYVSTDRLICTCYQVTPKQGNSQCLTSYHMESRLDSLAQLHELLSNAHWTCTTLKNCLDMFAISATPE